MTKMLHSGSLYFSILLTNAPDAAQEKGFMKNLASFVFGVASRNSGKN